MGRARARSVLRLALLLAVPIGCRGPTPEPLAPVRRIVLVTIDTLRADHVGAYGHPLPTTPFLDRLARDGVLFADVSATSASTGPSHASLLTGLLPLAHGLRRNGFVLDDAMDTVAERLARHGWTTAAFVSASVLGATTGVAQGFHTFDAVGQRRPGVHYQQADHTTDAVLAWADQHATASPLFLWVHYFDPHNPYHAPARHRASVMPTDPAAFARHLRTEQGSTVTPAGLQQVLDYDAEVRFVDTELARLYAALDRPDTPTLWIVTADHGEGLLNHGFAGHVTALNREQLAVPLIFHWTTGGPTPRRVAEGVVSLVDVMPTIVDLAGLPAMPSAGRTLRPALETGVLPDAPSRMAFAQTGGERDQCGDTVAFRTAHYKLIGRLAPGWDQVYATDVDPYELEDLAPAAPAAQTLLRAMMEEMIAGHAPAASPYRPQWSEVTPEMRRRLQELGYVP